MLEVGDDAVAQRPDGLDVVGRAADHPLGLGADREHRPVWCSPRRRTARRGRPRPRTYTSVFAVPRSTAMSRPRNCRELKFEANRDPVRALRRASAGPRTARRLGGPDSPLGRRRGAGGRQEEAISPPPDRPESGPPLRPRPCERPRAPHTVAKSGTCPHPGVHLGGADREPPRRLQTIPRRARLTQVPPPMTR
jgi:hypothetical protein